MDNHLGSNLTTRVSRVDNNSGQVHSTNQRVATGDSVARLNHHGVFVVAGGIFDRNQHVSLEFIHIEWTYLGRNLCIWGNE